MKNLGIGAFASAMAVPRLTELLSIDELARIAKLAVRRRYRDGETIHERGDTPPQVGVVVSGKIKLVYPRADGHEVFSGVIHTGQNYGDAALVHGESRPHRAVAMGDTVIDHLTAEALDTLLTEPAIARAFYIVASYRLSVSLDLLDDMRMRPPHFRLAKLVLRIHQANGGAARVDYLQEDLASMLGISTVTLAKALRQLEGLDLLQSGYRHVLLRDPVRLEDWIAKQEPR